MTIKLWILAFGIQALVALGLFYYQFSKNKPFFKAQKRPLQVIIIHWSFVFLGITSISMMYYLYMNWQEQIQYFLNR